MSTASRRWLLAVAAWVLGCGGADPKDTNPQPVIPKACPVDFVGDHARPPHLSLVGVDGAVALGIAGGTRIEVADGATVDLVRPPQGGHIVLIGARVENMAPCAVLLTTTVRDVASGHIVAQDTRTVNLAVEGGGAFAVSDVMRYSTFSNVPLCPAYTPIVVDGGAFRATVHAVDSDGRTATLSHVVYPLCRQSGTPEKGLCACECAGDYALGKCGTGGGP